MVSNRWFLIHLAVVVLSVAFTVLQYDAIPETFASHFNARGEADGYMAKNVPNVFLPNLLQLLMVGIFVLVNYTVRITRSKAAPASASAQRAFNRAWFLFCFTGGLLLVLLFLFIQLTMIYEISGPTLVGVSLAIPAAVVLLVIPVTVAGVRLGKHQNELSPESADSWKWGVFYYNPADSSLFVEKRIGVGATLNFARPASWIILFAILAIPIAIIWVASSL